MEIRSLFALIAVASLASHSFAAVQCTNTTSSALPSSDRSLCAFACQSLETQRIPNFNFTRCIASCTQATANISVTPQCLAEGCDWLFAPINTTGTGAFEAFYSSSRALSGLVTGAKALFTTQATGRTSQWINKGYLKDFGRYDACSIVDSATYCLSKIDITAKLAIGPFALCVPESCTEGDINSVFTIIQTVIAAELTVGTSYADNYASLIYPAETTCGDKYYDMSSGAIIMITICVLFIFTVTLATTWDYQRRLDSHKPKGYEPVELSGGGGEEARDSPPPPRGVWTQMLAAFSLFENLASFFKLRKGLNTGSLDGIRVFSMGWVIFGHTFIWPIMTYISPWNPGYYNTGDLIPTGGNTHAIGARWSGQVLQSAEFSVDTFFFMSGFLAAYISLKKFGNSRPLSMIIKAPMMYIHRYLRLTPLYAIILWFYTEVVPLMMHTPTVDFDLEIKQCRDNWWLNMLYIQTLFPKQGKDGCYNVTWYLGDDMMFFIFTPFLIAAFLQNRILGYVVPTLSIIASVTYSWVKASEEGWRFGTFDKSDYFEMYYEPPWTRCPPYLMGIIFGFFYFEWKASKCTLVGRTRLVVQVLLAAIAAVMFGSTVYGSHDAYQDVPSPISASENNAYIALAKPAWTLGVACMCFLCFERMGGPVQFILELPIFSLLSKLTYCMYLLHPIVLALLFFDRVHPLRYSVSEFSGHYLGALFGTIALSWVVWLVIETPLAKLEGQFMEWLGKMMGGGGGGRREKSRPIQVDGEGEYKEKKTQII